MTLMRLLPSLKERSEDWLIMHRSHWKLNIIVLEQAPYTQFVELKLQFRNNAVFLHNMSMKIRIYHDAAVAEVVTQKEYQDAATKKELCLEALRRFNWPTSIHNCTQLDAILNTYSSLELRANQARQSENRPQVLNLPPVADSIGCLYKDSWGQYSVNVYDLF